MKTLQNLIGGTWQDSRGTEFQNLTDPASGQVIARYPGGCADDVDAAVAAATAAQPAWAALSVSERILAINGFADAIAKHADELAELECQEMGQPIPLGLSFIDMSVGVLRDSSAEAETYAFTQTIEHQDGGQTRIFRHPLGVTAVITPWNFPVANVLLAIGPLLAAGNTVVVKPSERSPLSTARLFELVNLPDGVLNLVLGDGRAGGPLSEHRGVELVHFTGSVDTGRKVAAAAGRQLHRTVLELGGKDPVVVDRDVDVVPTAQAVAFGAFTNSGQICTSMERIYVHRDVSEKFIAALVATAKTYALGDGHDSETVLGPLVDERQRDIVDRHVTEAVARGAQVLIGGSVPTGAGFFYPATVLTEVDDAMLIMTEETFGPVAPVQVVSSFAEGLERASNSHFGLGATVYTNDPEHAAAAAAAIPAGILWVNQWQGRGAGRTYEPARNSGMGATGSHASYDAATRPATVYTGP